MVCRVGQPAFVNAAVVQNEAEQFEAKRQFGGVNRHNRLSAITLSNRNSEASILFEYRKGE